MLPSLEITLPGIPTTTELSGISVVITAFAPIITLFPIRWLPISFAPGPINTKSPIDGAPKYSPMVTPWRMEHRFPSFALPFTIIPPKCSILNPGPISACKLMSMPRLIELCLRMSLDIKRKGMNKINLVFKYLLIRHQKKYLNPKPYANSLTKFNISALFLYRCKSDKIRNFNSPRIIRIGLGETLYRISLKHTARYLIC